MKFKSKHFILFVALMITLISVASAADINDTTVSQDATSSTISHDIQQTDTTATTESNNNNEIKNTQEAINTVASEKNSGQTRNTTPTVWNISNANFSNIVTSSGLNSEVNDGDTLNFVSDVTRTGSSYIIDKPVTILGNQYTLNLNTGLNYAKTSLNFVSGASNSNITGLNLLNTQVYVNTSSNIIFDNIHAKVNNSGVGAGVGSFAIRDGSINVTVKNSYFETYSNGGYSTLVLTWSKNCTIENNTVYGTGNVGNLVYLNNYGGKVNANGIINNSGNIIKDNTITAVDPGMFCYALTITGANNSIINNTISNNRNYSVTTTWAGSYEETNPGDTHNVSYHGNKYINNTISGKFSTGNYSIVEGNWINGVSTIVGHTNVTNNTFLGEVIVNNNVKFHSNKVSGQKVTVKLPDSCFKNNTIGNLRIDDESDTYDCGENNITSFYQDSEDYFIPCNGSCPNCQSSSNMNQENQIFKKYLRNIKTDNNVQIADQYSLYSDNDLMIYSNGTAVITLTNGLSEYYSNDNPYSPKIDESSVTVTDIIIYVNYSPGFKYTQFNNKENINLRIIWNKTESKNQLLFPMGFKSVTCENYVIDMHNRPDESYDDAIVLYGDNLTLKNATVTYYPTSRIVNSLAIEDYVTTTYGTQVSNSLINGAAMFVRGQNILIEDCSFDIEIFQHKWNKKHTKCYPDYGVFIFESNNVTFSDNVINVQSHEKDLTIDVLSEYGSAIYGTESINDVNFINNEISVRFIPHINLTTSNSIFENNTITVQHTDKTIELTGDNNIVRYNTLTAGENEGDATVIVTGENNIVEQNPKVEPKTIIVTQDNVDEIFGGEGYTLSDDVNPGDTLDFQGTIDKEHSIVINKPVTVISSTKDAVINLHTVAGSLMGEDPGNSFVVNIGASGSYISGLYLNNTECWIHNVYNAVLYNMTMHVQDARVGTGVGQTSLRYCNNVTMDNCHIYTENNSGSSSFVWTGCNNCTIINSTVQGEGNVGNLLYVGNPFNIQDKPANYTITNFDNNVINCTILGGTGGISNPLQNGGQRTLVLGNKFYSGGSAGVSAFGVTGATATFVDNEFYRTVAMSLTAGSSAYNNVFYGTGSTSAAANTQVYNNTLNAVTISGANVLFENNTVKGKLTISQPVIVKDNNLTDVQVNANGKTSNITNNKVTGTITSAAANVNIDSNNITTSNDYTVVVTGATNNVTNNILYTTVKAGDDTLNVKEDTLVENNTPEAGAKFEITDENYAQFFDSNGLLNNVNVTNYSALTFKGAFNEKVFKFDNIIVSITGDDAVINNGFISTDNDATISVENVTFNNTKEGIENSVLLNTDGNLVRNIEVYRTSISGISREIMVNGDKNKVVSNKFNLEVPVENIDYSEYPFAISKVSAITVTGSNNNVSSNIITVTNTTSNNLGTISVIDLASRTASSANTVNSNTITGTSSGYLYGISLGANTDTSTVNSNNIELTSDVFTTGVQIGYAPAEDNTINSNTIILTSPIAYGIVASASAESITGTTINSNKINITADKAAGIELCGSQPEYINGATLTSNTLVIDGNYSIGIAVAGSDIKLVTNTITVIGTTNATDETSNDIIKPTTAGIIIQNSEAINAYNNTINATNGANVILNSTTDSKVISTLTTATRYINAENNANIVLYNSNNNVIDTQKAYTNSEYAVILTNSSNNQITNNNLNASNINGGDGALSMDENSKDNYLHNNIPVFGVLTDETYNTYFDENGIYKFPEGVDILTLAGDLHNKDVIFTNNVTFVNADKYTIYNGSIILRDVEGAQYTDRFITFRNINVNNTNKAAFVDDLSKYQMRNIQFRGGVFTITGDNITAFESVHENATYSILDVNGVTVNMDGKDVTAFIMTRDSYSRNDYIEVQNSNITLKATGKNRAFEVINTNLDILTNNILQEGGNVSTLYSTDVYANGQFFMNNKINVTGDNIALITLKDNHGSNPTFGNNSIYATSQNPVSIMNITNATNVYVGQGQYTYASYNKPNTIIVDAENGEVPLIYISERGYVRNNFIMSNDLYGVEAVSAATVSNITPTRTTITITTPEQVKVFDEITITANVANATTTEGTITLTINDEEITTATGNTITYTITPTTNETLNIIVEYSNTTTKFVSSSANATVTVEKVGTTLTLETNRPYLDENLTISGTLVGENNEAISGVELTLTINNETITVQTDDEGKYDYETAPVEGNNNIVVSFDGEDSYVSAEKSKSFIVIDLEKYALIDELNKTVNELNNTINELNNTINEQAETIDELNNTIQDLNNTINNQTEVIDNLNNTINNQTDVINDLNNTINDQQSQIDDIIDLINNLTAAKDTIITIDSLSDVKYNDEIIIKGILTTEDDISLNNQVITVTIGDKSAKVITNNGVFEYATVIRSMGEKTVTVTYDGSDKYSASESSISFDVAKQDAIITVDPIMDVVLNEEVTIMGTFTDANGKALTKSTVTVTYNGKSSKVVTDDSGVFTYTAKAAVAGENTVTFSYGGFDKFNPVEVSETFNVNKRDAIITIDPISDSVYKDTVTITGTFKDANGVALVKSTLSVTINGKTSVVKTDENGVFTITTKAGVIGENNITVSYAGYDKYNEVEETATFTVNKKDVKVTVSDIVVNNTKISITGKFSDADGNVLSNSHVMVTLNGKKTYVDTDSEGVYVYNGWGQDGQNVFTVGYSGSNNYNAYTSQETKLTVSKS